MKKLSFLFILLALTGVLFTSCSKDEDDPQDLKPGINFKGGTGYVSQDVTLTAGEEFKVGINANANSNSSAKLNKFVVTRTFNNIPFTVLDSTLNTSNFTIDIIAFANPNAGTERWSFKITDKDGEVNEISFNITTTAPAGNILTYSTKVLGSYQNTTGSSFASVDGTVYTLEQAKIHADVIDWLYFYGATNLATLAAPDDTDAGDVFNTGPNALSTWSVRNDTRFKETSLTAADFNSITTDTPIIAIANGASLSKANNLVVGDVIAFVTSTGKMGLVKVDAIVPGADGTMTISVKVQE